MLHSQSSLSSPPDLSRRDWMRRTAGVAGAVWAGARYANSSGAAQPAETVAGKPAAGEGLIDCHLHINHLDRNVEETIRHMDATGVEKAFILPLETGEGQVLLRSETVLHAYHQYPDRIIPFCQTDTRQPDVLDRLRAYHLLGCRGIGEQKEHLPLNDRRIEAIIALCDEFNWPITLHFQDGPKGYNQGMAEHLETYLKRYPKVRFIAHAQTWWANISADVPPPEKTLYPTGPVKRGGLMERLLADNPNLYGDMSAGSGYTALTRDPEYSAELIEKFPRQFLYGCDCPCKDGQGQNFNGVCYATQLQAFLRKIIKDEAVLKNIFRENALRAVAGHG